MRIYIGSTQLLLRWIDQFPLKIYSQLPKECVTMFCNMLANRVPIRYWSNRGIFRTNMLAFGDTVPIITYGLM